MSFSELFDVKVQATLSPPLPLPSPSLFFHLYFLKLQVPTTTIGEQQGHVWQHQGTLDTWWHPFMSN